MADLELRQAQLKYAKQYFKVHKVLPPRAQLPTSIDGCSVRVPGASSPQEKCIPPNNPPILHDVRSLRAAVQSPPLDKQPVTAVERPSRRQRDARKRTREVADDLAKAAGVPEAQSGEVEFVWDSEEDLHSDLEYGHGPMGEDDPPHNGAKYRVSLRGAASTGKVVLSFVNDGSQVEVYAAQVHKAVRILDPGIMRDVMCSKSCRCSRRCFEKFPLESVRLARHDLLNNTTNEDTATEYLAELLRRDNPHATQPDVDMQYKVADSRGVATAVCSKWWQTIRGLSNNKMQAVRQLVRSGRRFCAPIIRAARSTASDRNDPEKTTKYQAAYCFWFDFFEKFCNRPNADERLFPTNDTLRQMYTTWYLPWHEKMRTACDFPKCEFETFRDARYDPAFHDVLKRPKHNHCKCPNCLDLELWRRRAFQTQFEVDAYIAAYTAHRKSIADWRTFEKNLKSSAVTNAEELTVLEYDATVAHGFPHFGQRPPKGVDISRLWVVPTHISRLGAQQTYVYHLKEVLKKDANLCITMVYHQIRCAKEGGPGAHASKLALVADNAKDNKCDTMLAFAVELVLQGWYNEVHMDFGEVGHNHNGQDAAHHKLNANVGKLQAMTLGEEQCNYGTVWASGKAPVAVIQPFAYDWTHRYDIAAYRRITGYFRSKVEKETANAFCARKTQNGDVELVWKVRAQDPQWLGADGQPAANQYDNSGSPGFLVLTAPPMSDMRLARTSDSAVHHSYVTKVERSYFIINVD